MLTKFKKTLHYSLIWKEKNVVEFDLKKRAVVSRAKRTNTESKGMYLEGDNFRVVWSSLRQATRKFWENLEKICEFFEQTALEVSEYFKKNRESLQFLIGTCNLGKFWEIFEKIHVKCKNISRKAGKFLILLIPRKF